MQVKKQQVEPVLEQWTGSKLGKKYIKTVYFHLACLICMQIRKQQLELDMEQQTGSK